MLTPGTILMDKDTLRPQCLQLKTDLYPNAWIAVKQNLTPHDLEKELSTAGWTLFYLASPISTTAFRFNRAKMIDAALKRLIAQAKLRKCNCLEIDDVATRSFLSIPYVNVSAHARHIQKGLVFDGR
jgi:hypothetical protein